MRELPEKGFHFFSLDYGSYFGVNCRIKNHIILGEFTTKELEKEIKRRKKLKKLEREL